MDSTVELRGSPPVSLQPECDGCGLTFIGRNDLPRVSASAAVIEQRDGGAGDRFRGAISEYVDAPTNRTVKVWTDHVSSVGVCPTQRCAKLDSHAHFRCGGASKR